MITDPQLSAICGRSIVGWADPINAAMAEYSINTSARQSAFLAQILHESGRLKYVRELWGPTPAQKKYEGRLDLGNSEPGDGFKYRGRGLIQITGRNNYQACGIALELDLLATPELLEQHDNAARSAGWFWHNHGFNELADQADSFLKISIRINGRNKDGLPNGWDDRQTLWKLVDDLTTKG